MKTRTLNILVGVFVALAALFLLLRWTGQQGRQSSTFPLSLSAIASQNPDKVTAKGPEGSVTLVKSSKGWTLDESGVPAANMDALWKAMRESQVGETVSREKKNRATYGLDDKTARKVAFFKQGRRLGEILIGRPADVPGTTYVALADRSETWLLTGEFGTSILATKQAWTTKPPKGGAAPPAGLPPGGLPGGGVPGGGLPPGVVPPPSN